MEFLFKVVSGGVAPPYTVEDLNRLRRLFFALEVFVNETEPGFRVHLSERK